MRIGFRDTALIGSGLIVRRRRPVRPAHRARPDLGGSGRLLRRGRRAGARVEPDDRRHPVGRRLGAPRRRHGDQHVLPLHRQRGRSGGLRRHRQRDAGRPLRPPAGLGGRLTARQRRRDEPGARRPGRGRESGRGVLHPRGALRRHPQHLPRTAPGGRAGCGRHAAACPGAPSSSRSTDSGRRDHRCSPWVLAGPGYGILWCFD